MAKFVLSTDSCVDEFTSNLSERGIECVPLTYCFDTPVFDKSNCDEDYRKFYSRMREGEMPTTSQVNLFEATEYFEGLAKKYPNKEIVHLALSSGLSGTYDNFLKAANEVEETHAGTKIYVIDSLTATQGQSYLLDHAERCRNNGKTAQQTYDYICSLRGRLNHIIVVNDLKHLHRGGRISRATAVVGTMLQIKPIIEFNNKGKLAVTDKVKGITKCMRHMISCLKKAGDLSNQTVFIAQSDAQDIAESLRCEIQQEFPDVNIKVGWIGPVIGSHIGPGTFAIVYLGSDRPKAE